MKDWINLFINDAGTVDSSGLGISGGRLVVATNTIELSETKSGGFLGIGETTHNTFTILEVDHSGALIIEYGDGTFAYGDAEVYLVLERERGDARFLSAPVHEEIKVKNLRRVQLVILAPAGPRGASYQILCNAHCIFETKMDVSFEREPWGEASDWGGW
jgi:hypothetical protein